MDRRTVHKFIVQGVSTLSPKVEEVTGPLANLEIRPDPEATFGRALVVGYDAAAQRPVLGYHPNGIVHELLNCGHAYLFVGLVHELGHVGNCRSEYQQQLRARSPRHPVINDRRQKSVYAQWAEGTAELAMMQVMADLIRTNQLNRLVRQVFGTSLALRAIEDRLGWRLGKNLAILSARGLVARPHWKFLECHAIWARM